MDRRLNSRIRVLVLLWASMLTAGLLSSAASANDAASEYAVKSAIVYKITKFVTWPADAFANNESPLNICLTPGSPFDESMRALEGRKVRGHAIVIRYLGDGAAEEARCHVLVMADGDAGRYSAVAGHRAAVH